MRTIIHTPGLSRLRREVAKLRKENEALRDSLGSTLGSFVADAVREYIGDNPDDFDIENKVEHYIDNEYDIDTKVKDAVVEAMDEKLDEINYEEIVIGVIRDNVTDIQEELSLSDLVKEELGDIEDVVKEVVGKTDLTETMEEVIESAVEKALDGSNVVEKAVEEGIDNYDFDDKVLEAVASNPRKVYDIVRNKDDDEDRFLGSVERTARIVIPGLVNEFVLQAFESNRINTLIIAIVRGELLSVLADKKTYPNPEPETSGFIPTRPKTEPDVIDSVVSTVKGFFQRFI